MTYTVSGGALNSTQTKPQTKSVPTWATAANFAAVAQLARDIDRLWHDAQQFGM